MYKFEEKNFGLLKSFLEKGEVVVLPTDTIYGFSAGIFNGGIHSATHKIQDLKKRRGEKPFLLLVGNLKEAQNIVQFSPLALSLVNLASAEFHNPDNKLQSPKNANSKLSESSITLVLPRQKGALPDFFPKEKYLAVRIPQHKKLLKFLNDFWKKPLLSTSVNISGKEALNSAEEISAGFPDIPVFYEEGFAKTPASTVVKVKRERVEVLREGNISENKIHNLARQILKK